MILYDEDAQTLVRILCPGSILAHLFQIPESPIIGFRAASTEFSTPSHVIPSEAKNLNGRDAALRCPVGAARRPYHSGAPTDLCHPARKITFLQCWKPSTSPAHVMRWVHTVCPQQNLKVGKTSGAGAGNWPCIGVLLMRARPRL
jgi:hypothetical protein